MRGMGVPTAWTGRGTSLGQQECRTCPEGARDVLQVRLWAPGSPCSTSAHAQTPLAARSQVAPLGPAPQVCSPEGGLPKTNYVGTAPLPPALAASECPSLGTARLLPQLGAQGTEGVPPFPKPCPQLGHGCDAASYMGSRARGCPPATAPGIPQGWLGARLRVWHKQRQPRRRLPRAPGDPRSSRSAPAAARPRLRQGNTCARRAPGPGRGGLPAAAAWQLGTHPLLKSQRWGLFWSLQLYGDVQSSLHCARGICLPLTAVLCPCSVPAWWVQPSLAVMRCAGCWKPPVCSDMLSMGLAVAAGRGF